MTALGDGTRRAIVVLLAQSPASVSDLAGALGLTITAIGQHMAILEACQLASSQKTGRVRMCRIDQRGLDVLQGWIDAQRGTWPSGLSRLGRLLGEADTSAGD